MSESEKRMLTREAVRAWLVNEMSEISEECWSAQWLSGLEYILWEAVLNLPKDFESCGTVIENDVISRLQGASEILDEWVVYGKRSPDPIAIDAWKERFAEWKQQQEASDQ